MVPCLGLRAARCGGVREVLALEHAQASQQASKAASAVLDAA